MSFKIPLNRQIMVAMQIRNHGRSQKIDRSGKQVITNDKRFLDADERR